MQLALRKEMRRLEREADARLVVLRLPAGFGTSSMVVEHAGDDAVMPRRYPELISTVPSYEVAMCGDGEEHDALVHRI